MYAPYTFRKDKNLFREILQECLFAIEGIKVEDLERKNYEIKKLKDQVAEIKINK